LHVKEIAQYYQKIAIETFDGNLDSDKTLERLAKTIENENYQQGWECLIDFKLLLRATFDHFAKHGKKYDHELEGKKIEIKYSRRGNVKKMLKGLQRQTNPDPDVTLLFSVNTNNVIEQTKKEYGSNHTVEHKFIPNTDWIVFTIYQ
jgi:hypothetical protein